MNTEKYKFKFVPHASGHEKSNQESISSRSPYDDVHAILFLIIIVLLSGTYQRGKPQRDRVGAQSRPPAENLKSAT